MTETTEKRPYVKGGSECTATDCDRRAKAKGLCPSHYARAARGRDVHGAIGPAPQPVGDCTIEGCEQRSHARGLCSTHYVRSREGRPLEAPVRKWGLRADECTVDACGRGVEADNLCNTHYRRKRGGEADWDRPIKAKAADGEGHTDEHGYRWVYDGKRARQVPEHRVVMEQVLGRPLERHENVHHRNGARGDNSPGNLELWSTAQPAGQRPEDKVAFAIEMLRLYAPEHLAVKP